MIINYHKVKLTIVLFRPIVNSLKQWVKPLTLVRIIILNILDRNVSFDSKILSNMLFMKIKRNYYSNIIVNTNDFNISTIKWNLFL